jgi:hypothetical protein
LIDRHGVKVGPDDFLVQEGAQWSHTWKQLERLLPDDARLKPVQAWWQRWRERQATDEALRDQDHEALDLQETAGLYTVCSAKHHVTLTFDRLSEQRGGVTAELTITRGQTELLGETDISLKSDSSRDKIAKTLKGLASEVPWKRLLERACTVVLKRHREGEPVIILEPADSVHVPFVVNPLVYRNHPSLWYATGENLKSYLALYVALLTCHGAHQNGLAALAGPVLYLDWELDAETVGGRLKALQAGHPELSAYVPYCRRCEYPLHQEAHRIAREVAEKGVLLVILDSAAMACGGDLNSPETVVKLTRALRQIGCSSLLMAHVSKLTPEGQERTAFGSVFFRELSRNVWELERPDPEQTKVILAHTKNSFGPRHAPLAVECVFNGAATRIKACDPEAEPAFEPKLPLANRIRMFLEDGALHSAEEIAQALKARLESVKATLSNKKYNGRKWHLVGENREARWTVLNR